MSREIVPERDETHSGAEKYTEGADSSTDVVGQGYGGPVTEGAEGQGDSSTDRTAHHPAREGVTGAGSDTPFSYDTEHAGAGYGGPETPASPRDDEPPAS